MSSNIYPPILGSSQPAFINTSPAYSIYFTTSSYSPLAGMGHISIKVSRQANNKSIVNTTLYPDGVIYKDITLVGTTPNGEDYININSSDLAEAWQPNTYYKIQLRLGTSSLWVDVSNFASWKATQIENRLLSEWSTVMVLKAISEPVVKILNNSAVRNNGLVIESMQDTELTTTPLFSGSYYCPTYEPADKYCFKLYQGRTTESQSLLEQTGWLQHDGSNDDIANQSNSVDLHRFKTVLENGEDYTVTYQVSTINLYQSLTEAYAFTVVESFLNKLEGVELVVINDSIFALENACLEICLTNTNPMSGNFVISRSSEHSNYGLWEDMYFFTSSNAYYEDSTIYRDFTIESGVRYQYRVQSENSMGLRSAPLYELNNIPKSCDFEYSFLYYNNLQLRLIYNNKMSSFKHVTLANKQDSLGGRYPTVMRNGNAYYAEFPVSGLITLHMDEYGTFFTLGDDGYYYEGELIIPKDKYTGVLYGTTSDSVLPHDVEYNSYGLDLSHNNRFIERKFREKVEEFLNDGNYKLYKSGTEGNMIITLTNITLTPQASIGRMIFEFSATAYEVLENTLTNLNDYQIITIGEYSPVIDADGVRLFGQLHQTIKGQYGRDASGMYTIKTQPDNIIELIIQDNDDDIGNNYHYTLKTLDSIWVESFPQLTYQTELNALIAEKATHSALGNTEEIERLEQEIEVLQDLINQIASYGDAQTVTLIANGREINVGVNRPYSVRELNLRESDFLFIKYGGPIIINYSCQMYTTERQKETISSVMSTGVWDQLQGMFTETKHILDSYDYYRDGNSLVVSSNQEIGLYQTLCILDAVKESTKKEIEKNYNTTFTKYDELTQQWTDGHVYYHFEHVASLDIEADEGTIILIKTINSSDEYLEIAIGSTQKYKVTDIENTILDIKFKQPTHAIINYRCTTVQMTKG